jgi:hypothetical protein
MKTNRPWTVADVVYVVLTWCIYAGIASTALSAVTLYVLTQLEEKQPVQPEMPR